MRPANSTGHERAWTAPTSGRKRGTRHRPVASRPAEDGQQTPPDLHGRGTPLKVITTAANVNDVTRTLALVDGIPPVAGRPGRRPDALLGDKGYKSNPNRDALRKRRILPVISYKGRPNIKGMGKLRYVVEQTFTLSHHFKRLAVRWAPLADPAGREGQASPGPDRP